MPITSTTNALATITSVTNTLPTITNGTNIYLQKQITITDLSNINITNLITETTAITSWSDPALWVSGFVALIMLYTVRKMSAQNKISAESVNEMKRQYEQKEERDKRREEEKYLREYIDKNLMSEFDKVRPYKETINTPVPENKLDNFNYYSCKSLIRLLVNSKGLFYQKNITSIFNKISKYTGVALDPKNYSLGVKQSLMDMINIISENLYNALTDKDSYNSLIGQIDLFINTLEQNLTDNERKLLTHHV